jgi:predicted phosphodiesterase
MKIAFFSDIHANLPALEAVLNDIDHQQPDMVYCLGDLVGYNIWPNEVTNLIRQRGIPTLAGNYDEGIGLNSDNCGCAYKSDDEKSNGAQSIALTNALVTSDVRNYLRQLPRHLTMEFQEAGKHIHLLMAHGSPRKINEYLFEDREEKSTLRILEKAQADLLFVGHTHRPYHRILPYLHEEQTAYRHLINIGSVGKPKDGDPRACYALLTIENPLTKFDAQSVDIEFRRVEYDIERAAKAIEDSSLPNVYATALRKGV